jgi:hypothetical protein
MVRSLSLDKAGNARIVATPRGKPCIGSSGPNASTLAIVVVCDFILPGGKQRGDSVTIAYCG